MILKEVLGWAGEAQGRAREAIEAANQVAEAVRHAVDAILALEVAVQAGQRAACEAVRALAQIPESGGGL